MSELNVVDWQAVLKDIAEQKRHRLTGSEYKQLITLIDAQPKNMNSLLETRKLIAQLAQHQGPDAPSPFLDPGHNRAFRVESLPAAPEPGDERLRERIISGSRIFASREYGHTSEAAQLNERGEMGRQVHGFRLDVMHNTDGPGDRFDVYKIKTSTHIPYSTGMPGVPADGERKLHGQFTSFAEAGASIDAEVGVVRHSQLIRERQAETGIHFKEPPPSIPKASRPR
jgi:hypothetical protein